jgi:hypothetical protein
MSMFVFASTKGSPGVTTLATLVGASWPGDRMPILVECDPSGGDLAARFMLSTRVGWASLLGAARRNDSNLLLDQHLQSLPGGLKVLTGSSARIEDRDTVRAREAIQRYLQQFSETRDVLVDVGRIPVRDSGGGMFWLEHASKTFILLRNEPGSISNIHERSEDLRRTAGGELRLVTVGFHAYDAAEVQRFTGIEVGMSIPYDQTAADVATTGRGPRRRLDRSGLATAARRLSGSLFSGSGDASPKGSSPEGTPTPGPMPVPAVTVAPVRSRSSSVELQ